MLVKPEKTEHVFYLKLVFLQVQLCNFKSESFEAHNVQIIE